MGEVCDADGFVLVNRTNTLGLIVRYEGNAFALQTAIRSCGSEDHKEMAVATPLRNVKVVSSNFKLLNKQPVLVSNHGRRAAKGAHG